MKHSGLFHFLPSHKVFTALLLAAALLLLPGCAAPSAGNPPEEAAAGGPEESPEVPETAEEEPEQETVIIHFQDQDIEVTVAPPQTYAFSTEDPDRRLNWDELLGQYPDIQFWMLAPMAGVDSPVVLNPDPSDKTLYTGEEFNREPAPIIQKVTDYEGQDLLAGFRNYADIEFFRENPAIYLYRPKYSYEFLVFAAFHNEAEIDPFAANLEDYDGFNEYIDRLFANEEIGINLNPELKEKVQIEHRFLAVELPSSGGGSYLVLAVINGMVPLNAE